MQENHFSAISIVLSIILFVGMKVSNTNAKMEEIEYEWAQYEDVYTTVEYALDFVIGQFIDDGDYNQLCARATMQRGATARENTRPNFGLYSIKFVGEENGELRNLLECPTTTTSIYLKRTSPGNEDKSFALYKYKPEGTYLRLRKTNVESASAEAGPSHGFRVPTAYS